VSNAKIDFDNITCPSCGTVIPISETIHHQIAELTRQELASETSHARKALVEKEQELSRRASVSCAARNRPFTTARKLWNATIGWLHGRELVIARAALSSSAGQKGGLNR